MARLSRRDVWRLTLGAVAAGGAPAAALARSAKSTAHDLAELDAMATAEGVRRGSFTAVEATEAAIARIERLNPQIGAVVTPLFDRGRAAAAHAPTEGRLAGAPTLVKDIIDVKGAPTRQGSRAFDPTPKTAQSPMIDAVEVGGLVILGKSQTPELAASGTTEPLLGPITRNPWNTGYSVGGSSGGSAAAVASRMVPIAIGTDGGGSIRMPASCCGVFGLKVSRDRLLADGRMAHKPIDMSVSGALTRSVRDSAAFLALAERRDAAAPLPPVGFVDGPGRKRLRIGFSLTNMTGGQPDADVARVVEAMAARCRSLGHEITGFAWPFETASLYEGLQLTMIDAFVQLGAMLSQRRQVPLDQLGFEPMHLLMAQSGGRLSPEDRARIEGAMVTVAARYDGAFDKVDLVLTPVLSQPPPPIGDLERPGMTIDAFFERGRQYGAYTPIQNIGGGAAMSVPAGFSDKGLPIGAHFAGPRGSERTLLELAYELEAAAPWTTRKPPVSA